MKLIIDINEDDYKYAQGCVTFRYFAKEIANGIPLPKGCGRLIDARALENAMYHEAFETDSDMQKWDSGCWIRYKMFENALYNAPTIIEADKAGDVDENY